MTTLPRLSIVLPYRNRPQQLARFIPHLVAYFQRDKLDKDIPWRLTIVEQVPGKPFNRGLIKNIGFLLTEADHDYVCFHDVDYLPIWADYSYCPSPARLIWYGAELTPFDPAVDGLMKADWNTCFGGVITFPMADFRRINGYSNLYWGWGYEDTELRIRTVAEGLQIVHRDGTYEPIYHVNEGWKDYKTPTEENVRNREIFLRRRDTLALTREYRQEGLNTASYRVVERHIARGPDGNEVPNIERVVVEV
ncbi:MAG: galactosyltransferase [Alphaproteobacteria bacterium]|nr:galactosyltransferase [Alphaproteobacteria bacterium]